MAKKNSSRSGKQTRSTSARDLVRRPKASAYAKRSSAGRFDAMDDVGRSQATDKPRRARKAVRSGFGDQGDQRRRSAGKKR